MNPSGGQVGFKAKAWAVNKFATVARKQGLGAIGMDIIHKMYGYESMDIQEAFMKIKVQAKAYLDSTTELNQGIKLINAANLDYFSVTYSLDLLFKFQ